MSNFEIHDTEWAESLERGVEEYTDTLFSAVYEDADDSVKTLSGELFCGCSVCFWRETLFYLAPRIIQGYKDGKITSEE